MYTKYNIPQMPYNMQRNYPYSNNKDDRFIGGFVAPFILGGITGSLLTPRYNNYPVYYGPYPYPQYQNYYPYYSQTTNYY